MGTLVSHCANGGPMPNLILYLFDFSHNFIKMLVFFAFYYGIFVFHFALGLDNHQLTVVQQWHCFIMWKILPVL